MTRPANDNTVAGRQLQDKLDELYIAPWWISLASWIVVAAAGAAWGVAFLNIVVLPL